MLGYKYRVFIEWPGSYLCGSRKEANERMKVLESVGIIVRIEDAKERTVYRTQPAER